jgi:DNA polymerase-1
MMNYREAYELELGVIHCLREAELAGLMTDPDYMARACIQLETDLAGLKARLPEGFNPNSDRQVIKMLEQQGAVLTVRTEKGNLSVDKDVLRFLEPHFPVAGVIEEHRSKDRMLNSYLHKFQDLAVDGVLRPSTKPVGARTGRMSVTDPPLQTLPRGRLVRDAIVAREGHRLLMADFAGMELRAMASFAQEENMLAAFARGEDLHDFVCDQVYGAGQWTKQQRGIVKNAQFGKIYGAGVEKFAVTAKIPVHEAEAFLHRYDELFPGVARFQQRVIDTVMSRAGGKRRGMGYVTLVDGRRLPVEADKAYAGVNYLIQGSTAVSTKRKICELDAIGLGGCFRLAVHDELLYEVPEEHAAEAKYIVERVMPDKHSFPGVTLEIEADEVYRWGEHYRHDYEAYVPTELAPWLAAA